jgi:hypothetical protein
MPNSTDEEEHGGEETEEGAGDHASHVLAELGWLHATGSGRLAVRLEPRVINRCRQSTA